MNKGQMIIYSPVGCIFDFLSKEVDSKNLNFIIDHRGYYIYTKN